MNFYIYVFDKKLFYTKKLECLEYGRINYEALKRQKLKKRQQKSQSKN